AGYYWHGVGRALYFSREHFFPIFRTVWGAIEREIPPGLSQANAMAGLAWAETMVNLRQPKLMERLLQSHVRGSPVVDAFSYGVSSSIMMREDTTPDEGFVQAFYMHEPSMDDEKLRLSWNSRVAGPAKTALQKYYPDLKRSGRLGEMFQYQSL